MGELDLAKQTLKDEGLGSPKVEALVEAMFLAATSDGEFAQEEKLQFAATIAALTDKTFAEDALQRLTDKLADKLADEGRQARLSTVAQRLPTKKAKETALILAAAITASDGDVKGSENDLVADLAEALGIDPERTIELVTSVQNRG